MASRSPIRMYKPRQALSQMGQSARPGCLSVSPFHTLFHRPYSSSFNRVHWSERLPMIVRPSFWQSIIPKPLRKDARVKHRKENPPKEWNPATFFIMIFLLIGSNGIHFINLRQRYAVTSRQADHRIAVLREVLRRVQAGEDVDVEKMLGTGDPMAEQEWEEVIKHIEEEDRLWQSKEQKKARKQARKEAREAAEAAMAAENSPQAPDQFSTAAKDYLGNGEHATKPKRVPGFY